MNELIAASTADLVKKEDITTLQKLQEQFAAELATIRGRVDSLEARATTIEKQQFSTTTKLNGLAWFNVTGASTSGDIQFDGPRGSEGNDLGRFFATRTGGQPTRGIVLSSIQESAQIASIALNLPRSVEAPAQSLSGRSTQNFVWQSGTWART